MLLLYPHNGFQIVMDTLFGHRLPQVALSQDGGTFRAWAFLG